MNQVLFEGFLGKAPELRYTPAGLSIASFSIAKNEKGKNGAQAKTIWLRCVCFGDLAEGLKPVPKGAKLLVLGKLQQREYEAKDGQKKEVFEVIVNRYSVEMPSPKKTDFQAPEIDDDLPF